VLWDYLAEACDSPPGNTAMLSGMRHPTGIQLGYELAGNQGRQ